MDVFRTGDYPRARLGCLLQRYGLVLRVHVHDEPIPGSFWGDCEAGLVENRLYVRPDTPLHSVLHEACHYVCMSPRRRQALDTNAGGDYDEENAVCFLQILLADCLPGFGCDRMMDDMDTWGYSFRLGTARRWFASDAEEAATWLRQFGLIGADRQPIFRVRSRPDIATAV